MIGGVPELPELIDGLAQEAYVADKAIAIAVRLAMTLEKPLLIEGPQGRTGTRTKEP